MWRHRNIRGNPHRRGVEREWPNNIASLFIRERGLIDSEAKASKAWKAVKMVPVRWGENVSYWIEEVPLVVAMMQVG